MHDHLPNTYLGSFEDGDDVIYVHAYRSVTNGWHLGLTVIASRRGRQTTTDAVACNGQASFATAADAAAAGERLARAQLARARS